MKTILLFIKMRSWFVQEQLSINMRMTSRKALNGSCVTCKMVPLITIRLGEVMH